MSGVERMVVEHSSVKWRASTSAEGLKPFLLLDNCMTYTINAHIRPASLPLPYKHAILSGPEVIDREVWRCLSSFLCAVIEKPNGHTTFYRREVVVDELALRPMAEYFGAVSYDMLSRGVNISTCHIHSKHDNNTHASLAMYVKYLASLPLAQRVNGEIYVTADWFNDKHTDNFDYHIDLWRESLKPSLTVSHLWEGFV